jgi:hypothetical protein
MVLFVFVLSYIMFMIFFDLGEFERWAFKGFECVDRIKEMYELLQATLLLSYCIDFTPY